ncbi:hypothetical protein GGI12_001590 [Dipsacomyces acuminosporus]|nr:hypothetical protein GGI12_001590 [Dipsacomyces acuminosporus]
MDYEAARLTPVSNPSSLNYSDSFGSMSSFNNSSPYSARNQQQQQQQQQQQPHQSSNSKPNGLLGKMFRKGQPKHPKLKPAGISSKDYFANEDLYSTNTTPAPSQQQQQQQQQHQPLPATDYYEAPKGVKLTQKLSGFSAQRHQSFDQTAVDITAHPHMYPESPLVSPPPPPLPPPPPAGTWRRTAANIHTARHQQHAEGVAKSPGARHMPSAAAPPPDAQACEISESSVSSSSLTDTTLPAEVVNVANLGNIDKDFLLTIQKNSALEARRQRRREMRRKTMSFLNTSAATACEQSWATSPTSSAATSAAASRKNKSVFVGRANDRAAAATDDDDIRGHLSQKHHQQQQHGLPSSLDSPTIAAEFNHAAVDEIRLPSSEPPRAATAAAVAVSHANAENDIITPPHSHNMEATNNSSNVCKSHALQGSAAQRDRHHIANNGEAVDGRTLTTNSSTTSLRSHAAPGKTASIMHAHGLAAAPPPKTPATEDGPDNSCGIERSKLEAASNASSSIGNTHGSKDGLQLHSFSQKHKLDAASPVQRKAMLSDTDAAGATRNVVPPIPPLPPHVVSYSQVHSSPSSARSSPASSRPSTAGGRDSSSQPAPYSAPINAYDDMALHTPRAAMYGHSAGEWDAQMRKLQEYNISPHSARPQLGIVTNFVSPTSSIISINSGSATAVPDSGDNCGYHSIHSIMQASSTTAQSHQSYLQQQQQQRPSLATGLRKFSQPNAQLHDNSQSLLSPVGSPEFMSKSAANLHLRASVDDRVSGAGRLLSPTSPTRRMPLCKTQSEHGDLGAAKYSTLSKTTSHNDAPVVASLVGDPMARRKIRDQLASSTAFDRLLEEDGEFTMAISLTPKVAGHAAISTSRSTKAPAHLFKKWK